MFANRVFAAIETVLAWVVLPLQIVTTLVLGLIVSLTFGLLLLPISLIWLLLLGPLIGLSWLGAKVGFLREPIGILGLPIALLANTYVCHVPSMGELENRTMKILFTRTWPYSWEFYSFYKGRIAIDSPDAESLRRVLDRAVGARDALSARVVERIARREPLDS